MHDDGPELGPEYDPDSDTQEWRAHNRPRQLAVIGVRDQLDVSAYVQVKPKRAGKCAAYSCTVKAVMTMEGEPWCENHGDLVSLLYVIRREWAIGCDLQAMLADALAAQKKRLLQEAAAAAKRPRRPERVYEPQGPLTEQAKLHAENVEAWKEHDRKRHERVAALTPYQRRQLHKMGGSLTSTKEKAIEQRDRNRAHKALMLREEELPIEDQIG